MRRLPDKNIKVKHWLKKRSEKWYQKLIYLLDYLHKMRVTLLTVFFGITKPWIRHIHHIGLSQKLIILHKHSNCFSGPIIKLREFIRANSAFYAIFSIRPLYTLV